MIKDLPSIETSVAFWASVATLFTASGAWFTFLGAAFKSAEDTNNAVLNLIQGIATEIALAKQWALGDVGYPQSKTKDDLRKQYYDEWSNPSRQIFTFGTPTLSTVTSSPYMFYLPANVVNDLVRLNHSIRKLFDYLKFYVAYVFGNPELYGEALLNPESKTQAVRYYREMVFTMNVGIHQGIIGGNDSPDEHLFQSVRIAKKSLEEFKSVWRPPRLPFWRFWILKWPWWYWCLTVVAVIFTGLGIWEIARWFKGVFVL